jgi:hypothetical protein
MAPKKWEVCDKGWVFKEDWTSEHLYSESYGKPLCLICKQTVLLCKNITSSTTTKANIKEEFTVSLVNLAKGKSAIKKPLW